MSKSELPIEQMVKDAHLAIKLKEQGFDTLAADLAIHVLALADENERLRADLQETANSLHNANVVADQLVGDLETAAGEIGRLRAEVAKSKLLSGGGPHEG